MPATKKRKRTAKDSGSATKNKGKGAGETTAKSFWGLIDNWIDEKVELWGPKLNEPPWTE